MSKFSKILVGPYEPSCKEDSKWEAIAGESSSYTEVKLEGTVQKRGSGKSHLDV